MPRVMPAFAKQFQASCDDACRLATAGEQVRALGDAQVRAEMNVPRLEYLYEIAFLRVFLAWETFLEESFLRYMCGFSCRSGQPQRIAAGTAGKYSTSLAQARAALHGHQHYLLWHSPGKVIARSKSFFASGAHEVVISSNQARIEHFACIRHRVAHAQQDARQKFDAATMNLVGRRYSGSRVGRFLREADPSHALPTRWLASIAAELVSLAQQVVPP